MNSDRNYKKVKRFVYDSFRNIPGGDVHFRHCLRTVYWLRKLYDNPDEILKIAAVSHDIERAFRPKDIYQIQVSSEDGLLSPDFLEVHQKRGGMIISDFLRKIDMDEDSIAEVSDLVENHEFGGSLRSNLIKDADIISFFEVYPDFFFKRVLKRLGKEKIARKFDWTYNKASFELTKKITAPMHQKAQKRLWSIT